MRVAAAGAALLAVTVPGWSPAGPLPRDDAERRDRLALDVKAAFAVAPVPPGTGAALLRRLKDERHPDVRRAAVAASPRTPGSELDAFLVGVLANDPDAGVRGKAAAALGRVGTGAALAALATAAASDPETELVVGCVGGRGTARREATLAVADLVARFPKLADDAAAKLRALAPPADPKGIRTLAEARDQALYRVTRDEKLIAPALEQLRSKDPEVRQRGAIALADFKPTTAPPELVAALADPDDGVRGWAAAAAGAIGDPKTVPRLMADAADTSKGQFDRIHAIDALGRMRAEPAADLARRMVADPNELVRTWAAVALYRITGEKAKEYPAGYDAD